MYPTVPLTPKPQPEATAAFYSPLDPVVQRARQVLYRFSALALLDPRCGGCDSLAGGAADGLVTLAADVLREEPLALCSDLANGELPLATLDPRPVFVQLPHTLAEWNALYEQTFGLLASGPCPPYATEYIPEKFVFQRSNALADIAGYYRAFGVETSIQHPERPDHIVLQLEFMALLIDLETRAAAAADSVDAERAVVCRSAQQGFVREHLAWWVPALARLLATQSPGGFYAAVGNFLAALMPAERALLEVPRPSSTARGPSRLEQPEECGGCELASL